MRKAIALLFFCLLLLAAGIVQAAEAPPPASGVTSDPYLLRPGDVLAITVLGYDEFVPPNSGSGAPPGYLVRPDGKFSFPLIGEVSVQGLTAGELTEVLRTRLAEYLIQPKVTINLARLGGTRVYVLGEVVKPGSYEIDKAHNLLDAVTAAGGPTKNGAKRNVYVVRRSKPNEYQKVNLLAILQKGDQSQNVTLKEGDAVYLTSNNKINFATDIMPLFIAAYYVDRVSNKK